MKVMGVMTDEGLDSACARASVHPVSVQCSAPSASVQPVRKSICTHCSTFLMPMMYLSTGTMYMCTMYNVLAYMYILSAMSNVLEYKVHCT